MIYLKSIYQTISKRIVIIQRTVLSQLIKQTIHSYLDQAIHNRNKKRILKFKVKIVIKNLP